MTLERRDMRRQDETCLQAAERPGGFSGLQNTRSCRPIPDFSRAISSLACVLHVELHSGLATSRSGTLQIQQETRRGLNSSSGAPGCGPGNEQANTPLAKLILPAT